MPASSGRTHRIRLSAGMAVVLFGLLTGCGGYYGNQVIRSAPHAPIATPPTTEPVSLSSPPASRYTTSCAPVQVTAPVGAPHTSPGIAPDSAAVVAAQAVCGVLRKLNLLW